MKKFICTEKGVWQEVTRVDSENHTRDTDRPLIPASPEDTEKLEKRYLDNKPKFEEDSVFTLIAASIKMGKDFESGKIIGRINGNHIVINIK